jgi:hypothetical protein
MTRQRFSHVLLVLLLAVLACVAPVVTAQDESGPTAGDYERQAFKAIDRKDWSAAEAAFRQQLALDGANFVVHYNLACVCALQDRPDEAVEHLLDAVDRGFADVRQIQTDPQLSSIRNHPTVRKLVDNWDRFLVRRADRDFAALKEQYGPKYAYVRDDRLRLLYASAFDAQSFKKARDELTLLAEWADENLFPGILNPEKQSGDVWVKVVLPTREHFLAWAVATYGPDVFRAGRGVGGNYSHDQKLLIAQDLGATLRHEFMHVLHWRSNMRAGQVHPVWIQEGLCSLVEDYDTSADGRITLTPSWRSNMVKRLERVGRLPDIERLAHMPRRQFVRNKPLANYAQARTFFLYLYAGGHLKDWYRVYTETYGQDKSGVLAIERTLGMPMEEVNRQYQAWVRALPEVPDINRPSASGSASLGVEVEPGTGDGPVIVSVLGASNVRRAGLRRGDVVTAINGRPTRDLNELMRVLADYEPGDTVTVSYRRRNHHGEATLQLVPK